MSWIVDGHNLIPKIPGMSLSMPDDEEQLIKLLINFTRVKRRKLIVYFDNAPPGGENLQKFGFVSVYYVRAGRSADSAIRGKLGQLRKGAKNWIVVSSDRAVQSEARSAGASVVSSEEFSRAVMSVMNDTSEGYEESQEVYPDDFEIQQWMDLFNKKPDDE